MTELVFREDAYARECEARVVACTPEGVVLDRTVFYYESGGQPGDTGVLALDDGRLLAVSDARRGAAVEGGVSVLHKFVEPAAAALAPGTRVTARIDWDRRHRLMRMHTCLHLLSAVIIAPVTGGQVGDGYGRLDFDLPDNIDAADVEAKLNALIARKAEVSGRWISDAELDAHPELVKTMSVAPPRGVGRVRLIEVAGIDLQPCGGTHVANSQEIGRVIVAKVEKKGSKNRRVRLEFAP